MVRWDLYQDRYKFVIAINFNFQVTSMAYLHACVGEECKNKVTSCNT